MQKSVNKTIGVLAVILLMSVSISGQEPNNEERPKKRPTVKQIFKDLDSNEDGKLSKKEVKGPLKNDFKKIDTDEDGFISKKELVAAPKPERKERPRD